MVTCLEPTVDLKIRLYQLASLEAYISMVS